MNLPTILRRVANIAVDALFPISKEEKLLAEMSVETALEVLPTAPKYDSSVLPLGESISMFAYKDEVVSKLIWNIKYKKNHHSIEIGAFALFHKLEQTVSSGIIIPIPITKRRRRERGYNQCELITHEMRRLDKENKFLFEDSLLDRVQHKSRQTMKGREERLHGTAGIFEINKETAGRLNKNLPVIIIDDVITTGSTMKQAIDTLRQAGFDDVRGLSLAH